MNCERCHREVYKYVVCDYCSRKIGQECIKSSKKKSKTVKLVICKDDWSKMANRKAYKSTAVSGVEISSDRPRSY